MVLNFIAPRYTLLFLNSEIYVVHVINCEWSRYVNFQLYMFCMRYKPCFSNRICLVDAMMIRLDVWNMLDINSLLMLLFCNVFCYPWIYIARWMVEFLCHEFDDKYKYVWMMLGCNHQALVISNNHSNPRFSCIWEDGSIKIDFKQIIWWMPPVNMRVRKTRLQRRLYCLKLLVLVFRHLGNYMGIETGLV